MDTSFPLDPVRRSAEAEKLVMRAGRRKYHKFRAAPYYGGIATADAVGCSFLCAYCWNYGRNQDPSRYGDFCSPEYVAKNLLAISRKRNFHLFRVTGSEPVLGEASFNHLLKILKILFAEDLKARFILETNGLILGAKKGLIEKLNFERLSVRIALKGVDPASFEKITGAKEEFFRHPLVALQELAKKGLDVWPALMGDLFSNSEIRYLKKILAEHQIKSDLEIESLEGYPFVLENMRRRGVPVKIA